MSTRGRGEVDKKGKDIRKEENRGREGGRERENER